jgi:subtilisin-like proprotein convertase family protein
MNTYSRLDVAGLCDRGLSALALLLAAVAVQGQIIVTQSTAIAINDNATASPYPSVIDLTTSRFPGLIQKVAVSISGLTHPFAPDLGLLLVGPNGKGVVLMSGAGANPSGNSSLNAADLTFSDDASSSLPASSPLISGGVYKPTDNAHIPFPSPAPISGYSSSLGAAFAMTSPNGVWRLFALDTTAGPSSPITAVIDSWSLSLFLGPEISNIPTLRMPEESSQSVNFTVADVDGVVTNVAATIPVNTNLVNITTTLNGTNVVMSVQGNFNQSGTNSVEVVAVDNNGFAATNHFDLELFFVCPPPSLGFIPAQDIPAGDILTLTFRVYTPCGSWVPKTVRATSDNQNRIPDTNIVINQVGTNEYALTAFTMGVTDGSANITIVADDGVKTVMTTFTVFFESGDSFLVSSDPITINGSGAASPYATAINVTGWGPVARVAVTLFDVNETITSDLTLLLVGPSGTNVLLMAGAGGANALTHSVLVFDSFSTNTLPRASPIISGTYHPTAYGSGVTLPEPAPAPVYGADLSIFKGTNPNGNWLLYVAGAGTSEGSITAGWQLSLQTFPNVLPIEDQFTQENVTTNISVIVGGYQPEVALTTVTANGDPTLFKLPITVSGSGVNRTLTIVPQPYTFGTNTITVNALDPDGNISSAQFQMGVTFAPQPPLFVSVPADQTLCLWEDDPMFFSVWSPQGGPLRIVAVSPDNPTLIPSVEVFQVGSENGTNRYSLSLIPSGVATGTATILIEASDGTLRSTATFKITVPTDCGFFAPVTVPISIPPGPLSAGALQEGEATPYPSIISVNGLSGVVTRVTAILIGLNHQHPEDLDILLVSPDTTRAVMLMGHAGLGSPANSLRITFADNASPIPAFGTLSSQTYGPANYSPGLSLPLPAPAEPYETNLSVFNGLSPNGDWKLYVLDDTYPDGGSIDGGWLLRLELAPQTKLFMSHNGDLLSITVNGATNSLYALQSSLDLVNWSDAGNVTTGADGTGKFDSQIDTSATARFYRLLVK